MSMMGANTEFVLAELAKAAAGEAIADTPTPVIRPATVVSVSILVGEASVLVDGDTVPVDAQIVGLIPALNTRVMVLYNPPHGLIVLGPLGGGGEGVSLDFAEVNGGANEDLTAVSFVLFPSTAPDGDFTFLAPPFAVRALATVQFNGLANLMGRNRSQFRTFLGPAAGFPVGGVGGLVHTVEGSSAGSSTPRRSLVWSNEFTVGSGAFNAGLDARLQVQGQRTIGPGVMRRDTLSTLSVEVRWSAT